jgi:hypothetical protein
LLGRLDETLPSAEKYVAAVRAQGLVEPWSDDWERLHRYELEDVFAGVRTRTSAAAVAEDRACTATQDPHDRWSCLSMPTLLLRASRELRPGSGCVVPVDDCVRLTTATSSDSGFHTRSSSRWMRTISRSTLTRRHPT